MDYFFLCSKLFNLFVAIHILIKLALMTLNLISRINILTFVFFLNICVIPLYLQFIIPTTVYILFFLILTRVVSKITVILLILTSFNAITLPTISNPFPWIGSNCLKAAFDWSQKEERLSWPWNHPLFHLQGTSR